MHPLARYAGCKPLHSLVAVGITETGCAPNGLSQNLLADCFVRGSSGATPALQMFGLLRDLPLCGKNGKRLR